MLNKYYIGYTSNLLARIEEHRRNIHKFKFIRKQSGSWKLGCHEKYQNKTYAIKREREIKRWKSEKKESQFSRVVPLRRDWLRVRVPPDSPKHTLSYT